MKSKPICLVSLMCFFDVAKGHPAFRHTRVIQKVLLCTKYYVISYAYPYLVYSNLLRKVS